MIPIQSKQGKLDPAVAYENQRSTTEGALTESYFEYQGLDVHYEEAGPADADAIVFTHGFPSFWYSFTEQLNAPKADYRIIANAGLGVGRSDAPRDSSHCKLDKMCSHLHALLKSLGIQKAHLVGHDWGSVFVQSYAQAFPERVKSVAGLSAPPLNVFLSLIQTNVEQR